MEKCEICGATEWTDAYCGPVRDGVFGAHREDAVIARCGSCGVERLAEEFCTPNSFYETDEYRRKLQQGLDSESFYRAHDELQIHTLKTIWPQSLRNLTIADIGCAAGSLLDHLKGVAAHLVAVEPYEVYRQTLREKGYDVFPYAADAAADWRGRIDFAFSIQVIEHTSNPRAFLEEIRPLLAPGGRLVISTPNVDDILFDLLPEDYPAFFYRVVHRWYFDAESLANCARLAGFDVVETRHVHRYGLSNALKWVRDRRPGGRTPLDGIEPVADDFWRGYLEQIGRSDCLYALLGQGSQLERNSSR